MSETKYDIYYNHKNAESFNGTPSRHVMLLLKELKKTGRSIKILDIAAGDGRHTIPAAQLGFQVDAVEISKIGVGTLQRRLIEQGVRDNVNIFNTNLHEFLFYPNMYDFIIFVNAIHFIQDSLEVVEYLKKMKKSTKKCGIHYITMPCDTKIDGRPYENRLLISPEKAISLLVDCYKDWTIKMPISVKNIEITIDETYKKSCLYTAKQVRFTAENAN